MNVLRQDEERGEYLHFKVAEVLQIQNLLEDKLAEAVLDGEVKAGDEVTVTKGEDSLKFLSAEVIKN